MPEKCWRLVGLSDRSAPLQPRPLRLFVAEGFGIWLGSFTLIQAHDEEHARALALAALEAEGLRTDRLTFKEYTEPYPSAHVIWNGDY